MDSFEDVQVVRVGGWEEQGWLRHGFSTRAGGVSAAYGGGALNLGWTKEDEAGSVAENRRRFVGTVAEGFELVGVRQTHSALIRVVGDEALEGRLATEEGRALLEGDGLMTDVPGVLLGVGTADCVPVLVVDAKKGAVAAFHAGWRGTVARIVERGIERMGIVYASQPEDLMAAVGPSIGGCCYAVGEEVRMKFKGQFGYAEELFREGDGGSAYLDLWEANRRQLLDAGVTRVAVVGECTACARDGAGGRRYFSHRAEGGVAGRMLSVVGIAG
jgi:YfiH family protein